MKMFRENFVFSIQNISNSKASKIQFRSSFCGRSFTNEEYKCEMNVSPNMNTAKKKKYEMFGWKNQQQHKNEKSDNNKNIAKRYST